MLDGEVSIEAQGEAAVTLHANDFAYLPPDLPHRWVSFLAKLVELEGTTVCQMRVESLGNT